MEENLVGYLIGALDPESEREVANYLASRPEEQARLELLRVALLPLASDRDGFEPPNDLAVRAIGFVAEHVVATEGSVGEVGSGSVSEFLRSLGQKDPPLPTGASVASSVPVYPRHGSAISPTQFSRRNLLATLGLSAAMLMIGLTAVLTLRQLQEVHACANNMRAISQGLNIWCDTHNSAQFPQVNSDEDVRTALEKVQQDGALLVNQFSCPGASYSQAVPVTPIDYAYTLGYRDENGKLWGPIRAEDDHFPILADAPERQGRTAIPVNHRQGQNVLFAGGHVHFYTSPTIEIGGKRDDIFFNTHHEAHAGTERYDIALGKDNEQP